MTLSLPQIVILFGTVNGAILLFSLSNLPPRFRLPTKYLGLFILGYTLYLFNWMIFPEIGYQLNTSIPWIPSLYFLPALAYYFAKSIKSTSEQLSRIDKLYLLPGILDVVFQLAKWIYVSVTIGTYVFPLNRGPEFFIYEGFGLVFSIFCLIQIYQITKNLSYKKGTTYVFYKHAFYFLIFVLIRWIVMFAIDLFKPALLTFELQFTFRVIDLAFFLFLGFKSLVTPNMYSIKLLPSVEANHKENDLSKRLIALLKDDQMYLNPDLGRSDLSKKMDLTEIQVSSILNDGLNTTFYGLVNQMRVEEAKRLLKDGLSDQLTLEGVAKEAGFRSKTTFYKFFRKHTGFTPTEFLRNS